MPPQRLESRQRDRVVRGVARDRVRGVAHDHHPGLRVDVDALAVHAARHVGAVVVVRHPPHVAVAPALQQRVAALDEGGLVAAAADVFDGGLGHDLPAFHAAVVAQHLAEAREVAQARVQAAAREGRADGIDGEVGVLLGAQVAPDALRQQLRHGAAGGARDHPAQHVGVDGLVAEAFAMLAFRLHGLQELVIAARAGVVLRLGQRVACLRMGPDLGLRVGVVLAELQARGHVEHLAHGGVAEGRGRELGHVVGDRLVGVERAFGHQHRAQRADHRLGDRHGAVLAVVLQHAEVALVDHAAAVQHEDAVGVGGGQRCVPGHGRLRAERREAERVDVLAQSMGQGGGRTEPARHVHGRHQLAEIRHAPAHRRKLEIAAVVETQRAVGRWRRTGHPAEPGGVAGGGVGVGGIGCAGRHREGGERGAQQSGGAKAGSGRGEHGSSEAKDRPIVARGPACELPTDSRGAG